MGSIVGEGTTGRRAKIQWLVKLDFRKKSVKNGVFGNSFSHTILWKLN